MTTPTASGDTSNMGTMCAGIVRLGRVMLFVGKYRIEEGDDFRITISRDWRGSRISRVWLWRVFDTGEWVVIHVIEALMIASNTCIEYCNYRTCAVQSEVLPNCIDSHIGDCFMHIRFGKA